jgi:DNA repair exonuclease SbcCD ATPase subunit
MGLFRNKQADEQIATLRAELDDLRRRLDESDRAKATLEHRVSELRSTNAELLSQVGGLTTITTPPTEPPPTPSAADDPRIDTLEERLAALDERTESLDDRVTSVSTELTNQLSELSGEIDALSTAAGGDASAELEELRDGAERLAAEQARYQIQFRQDLAELAERLRRTNPG